MLENFAQDVARIRARIGSDSIGFVRHDRILSAVTVLGLLTAIVLLVLPAPSHEGEWRVAVGENGAGFVSVAGEARPLVLLFLSDAPLSPTSRHRLVGAALATAVSFVAATLAGLRRSGTADRT